MLAKSIFRSNYHYLLDKAVRVTPAFCHIIIKQFFLRLCDGEESSHSNTNDGSVEDADFEVVEEKYT